MAIFIYHRIGGKAKGQMATGVVGNGPGKREKKNCVYCFRSLNFTVPHGGCE